MPLNLPARLPTTQKHNRALYEVINQVMDVVESLAPVVSHNTRTSHTSIGVIREIDDVQPAESGRAGKRLQIAAIFSNYLDTRPYDDAGVAIDANAVPVIVAIPYFLRASTYAAPGFQLGSFFYTTVATQIRCSLGGSATDYIVKAFDPIYQTGQDIYAIQPDGMTDVTVAAGVVRGTSAITRLEWIDANVEGRRLITVPRDFTVCRLESGVSVARQALIDGGPIH